MHNSVDIDAYFERIGFRGTPRADLATLRELHLKHPIAIPFENLSTLLREPIPLDPVSLQRKMIGARRGGYCFEHNRLFAEVLTALGFEVAGLAARVVWNRGDDSPNPRTHMILRIDIGPQTLIADVGFGGLTLTGPLQLEEAGEQRTPHEVFRILRGAEGYEVQAELGGAWKSLYRFDLQEQLPIDFEVLNHFVATHPESHFLTTLMAARRTPDGRYALLNNELAEYRGADRTQRKLVSADELASALTDVFGVNLPRHAGLAPLFESIAAQ
jgi:N-hydroxyarylamine O-acetyltransferase